MSDMVSIMIPTMNRPDFLQRALYYYRSSNFRGWIVLADSSDDQNAAANLRIIENVSDKLQIIYRHYPKSSYGVSECVQKMIDLVPTPYAVESGDDDFAIPSGMTLCRRFLDKEPEFISAFGHRINVKIAGDGTHGDIENASVLMQPEPISDSSTERWAAYLRNGRSTLFYVTRIEVFRRDAGQFYRTY